MPVGFLFLAIPVYFAKIGARGIAKGELSISAKRKLSGRVALPISLLLLVVGFVGIFFGFITMKGERVFDFFGIEITNLFAGKIFMYSLVGGIAIVLTTILISYIPSREVTDVS
jgi:hypothetical protein